MGGSSSGSDQALEALEAKQTEQLQRQRKEEEEKNRKQSLSLLRGELGSKTTGTGGGITPQPRSPVIPGRQGIPQQSSSSVKGSLG